MTYIEKKQKLDYLLYRINHESTGTVHDMSKSICVSKRTVLRYIDELRLQGYPVGYCARRNTYYIMGANH
jgi:predicted DNA-binding transcriptional regulator YafY